MWWILLILLVTLVGVFLKRRELGESANSILMALVVVTLIVSFYSLFRGRQPARVQLQPDFYVAAGAKIGEAVAADLPQGGPVLVLHLGRMNDTLRETSAAYLDGLKKGFGAVAFKIIEDGPTSADDADTMLMMENALPLDVLARYVEKAGPVQAVISIVGPPQLTGPRPANFPPLYLIGSVDKAMADDLIRAGLVRGAVVFRDDADWKAEPKRGMSLDEIFKLRYELRRPAR